MGSAAWDTHRGVKKMLADMNALLRREPALHELDFEGTASSGSIARPRRQRAVIHTQG